MKYSRISVRDIVIRCCLSSVMLFQACDSSNDGVEYTNEFYGDAEIIRIDPKNDIDEEYSMKASLIVSSIDYYPLTLPGDMIIGEIEKMIHHNGHVYIFDRHTESIFIFNDEGEFINAIQSKGEGPEEYGDIKDFEVDRSSGNVLIYSPRSQKILRYTITGEFFGAINNKIQHTSFFPISDSKIAIYNSRLSNGHVFERTFPIQPRFIIANDEEEVEKQDLETAYREQLLMFPFSDFGFYQIGDSLRLMDSINSVIYRVDLLEGRVYPRFIVDFAYDNPPRLYDMDDKELSLFMDKFKESRKKDWASIYKVFESKDHLFISYGYDGLMYRVFFSKRTKELVNSKHGWVNDIDNFPLLSVETVTNDGYFLSSLTSDMLSMMVTHNKNLSSQRILDLEKSQRDAESIILVKFRLKDF
ncbi:6-bladed beta-propeller [Belliella sp. DSM 111904]|uniref:6-bladed beta-propeller n=1 Tax=Belliella filtrata TaxID=2923435 RepID=A0ABS9V2H1_9BACT|nr:6-bladed beta-propeller [Belliella filtrata]MCH7410554.1 6-bladed beta-propeller [Belliella filtrata]